MDAHAEADVDDESAGVADVAGVNSTARTFRRGIGRLLDLIFPRDCVVTDVPVDNPPWRYLSPDALDALQRVQRPHCETCGFPFFGVLAGTQICPHCNELDPVFQHGRTAVLARGPARKMVIELKYHQGLWIAEDIARVILTTPGYPEYLEGAVLVPVPLHAKRLRRRGYNQSRLIVEHLARLMPGRGVRVADILARTRDTPTQTRLNREARARNAAGAFAVKRGATPDAGARHVVFDDVFTTGATLNACCRALFGAGATNLDVASFAHG